MTQKTFEFPLAHREATNPEPTTPQAALETGRQPTPVFGEDGFPDEPAEAEDWFDHDDAAETSGAEDEASNLAMPVLPVPATPWQALINEAITRIAPRRGYDVQRILNFPIRPVDEPPAIPLATTLSPGEIVAEIAALRDPFARRVGAHTCRPSIMLNVAALTTMVPLTRAIGSEARRVEITEPGHLTVISGADKLAMMYLGKLLEQGLCTAKASQDRLVAFELEPRVAKEPDLPGTAKSEIEEGKPVVLIPSPGFVVPPGVAATADTHLTLGAFDTEAMVYMLRLSHSTTGEIAEDAVRKLLPPDPVLASFTRDEIAMALRKPTAIAVARHLAGLAAKRCKSATRFADYPMAPELRAKAQRLLDDIRAFGAGEREWKDCLSGILLFGPPGVGKTDFARLIAAEAGVLLVELGPTKAHGAGYLNDAIKLLTEGFAKAKASAPALVLIDEMDAIGNRNREERHTGYRDGLLAAFLSIMDGIEGRPGVFVVGATNHRDRIDPALIRPGRFDAHLRIDLPEPDLILPILRWHLGTDLTDTDLTPLIPFGAGHSHAELACIVRDARAKARGENRALSVADLTALLAPGRTMPVEVRNRIAIHEAGHAVARFVLTRQIPEHMIITPDGGLVTARIETDPVLAKDYHQQIVVLLAGRAAECVLLGEASAGSGGNVASDLAQATAMAAMLETSLGLGESGLLWLGPPEIAGHLVRTDSDLGNNVTAHLNDAEAQARRLIERERRTVLALAKALNARGYLSKTEIEVVVKGT